MARRIVCQRVIDCANFCPLFWVFLTAEFFIDGLGILHIGSCSDVVVDHASKIKLPWLKSVKEKQYAKFRYPNSTDDMKNSVLRFFYFKNHFKCMTGN